MTRTARFKALLLGGILFCGSGGVAIAQTNAANGSTVYEAAFFQTYSPSNALDIVRRVPGFTLDNGAQDVRGFGQAAGNVVINGARPSSKSDTLETILARLPAARVLRVEVGPGDLFGAEYAGRPQVLNLVLDSSGGLSGTIDASLRRDFSGQVRPEATVSVLTRRGPSTFNLSIGATNNHTPEEGTDTITAPDGTLVEFRRKYNDILDRNAFVAGSWEYAGGENRGAHLNFRAQIGRFTLDQTNDVFPVGGTIRDDRLSQDYGVRSWELGGDVTRPLAGGGLKLIGLLTRRHRDRDDTSFNRIQSQTVGGFVQEMIDDRDESLVRLVWSRQNWGGWSVEAGGEFVLNRLDSDVNLFAVGAGGALVPIDLPVDEVVVKEYRGEAFVNAGRSLADNFRMDFGLVYETSRLTVSGDAEDERTLRFLKPRASFDWRPGNGWHTTFSITRTVAQLNFEDFVSAADLASDRVNSGNPDLVPQRAWEFLAMAEHPILGDGVAKVELGYQLISMVQDRVPTPEGFDAPGNLGDGTLAFVRGTLDAPLGRLGIRGGRLTINGTLRSTSVEDPYTHENRRFSGYTDWALEAAFRQDLGRFAWGVNFFGSPSVSFFRLNEVDTPNGMEPFVTAFVEYRPTQQTTLSLGADNIFEVAGTRERVFFFPNRTNPNPSLVEYRERNSHVSFRLRVRHSFG